MRVYMRVCMHVYVLMRVHGYMYVCVFVCACSQTCESLQTHVRACMLYKLANVH